MKENPSPKRRMQLHRIQSIFKMHEHGKTNREISRWVGCSASTVSATLNKYRHPDAMVWSGMSSYEKAKYVWDMQKAQARGKRRFKGHIADVRRRKYIIEKLVKEKWSPEAISHLAPSEVKVSTATIYRFLKKEGKYLREHLYEKGKPRRQRVANRRGRFSNKQVVDKKKYIDERPIEVNERKEFGHWEGDLMVGPRRGSKYVILSLVERKSRKSKFTKMPNREAATTLSYLRALLLSIPEEARKSVTLDNGTEFTPSSMHKLQELFPGFKVYYTEPYSPEQKGSNENMNGRFRKTFPKKTDFAFVPKGDVTQVEKQQNNRPVKLHGYKTAGEVFEIELAKAQSSLQMAA